MVQSRDCITDFVIQKVDITCLQWFYCPWCHRINKNLDYLDYSFTIQYVFDYHPNDVFACVADVGWVMAHSYVVYGPLCNGATTVLFGSTATYSDPGTTVDDWVSYSSLCVCASWQVDTGTWWNGWRSTSYTCPLQLWSVWWSATRSTSEITTFPHWGPLQQVPAIHLTLLRLCVLIALSGWRHHHL